MSYRIVVDSCCDFPDCYKDDPRFVHVPLNLEVGSYRIVDDETFDQAEFLKQVASCSQCPKSACPSPQKYEMAYDCEAEDIFVVTLSSRLSGSFQSAVLGRELYVEDFGIKNIHVIDSKSASCGETLIALRAMELEEANIPFDEIVKQLEKYRDDVNTYFVLDNLETLRKNGRLSKMKAFVASTLSIKPILAGTRDGEIEQRGQALGIKKSLAKMVDIIVQEVVMPETKRIMIAHCNCRERAEEIKNLLTSKVNFREALITDMAGISSMYANDGGIIVTV